MTTVDPGGRGGVGRPLEAVAVAASAGGNGVARPGADKPDASDTPDAPDTSDISAKGDRAAGAGSVESACTPPGEGEICEFIPVSRFALMERLSRPEVWPDAQAEVANRFFRYLGAWRNLDYTEKLMKLKEAYLPFSPDRDTVRSEVHDHTDLAHRQAVMIKLVTCLVKQANYKRIDNADLQRIFSEDSPYGLELEVDLNEFEELLIYRRGAGCTQVHRRSFKTLFLRKEIIDVPFFQRLFLLLKLKPNEMRVREIMASEHLDEKEARKILARRRKMLPDGVSSDYVYLKLFKQIACADLKMMFPNTRVQFRPFDKVKLVVTAGGGTAASLATTVSKILIATNPLKAAMALVGLISVVFRQVMNFFNQRNQYMMVLAQNLYFHNLADNRGVLTLLADRAEEEDIKEEYLLYCVLAKGDVHRDELPAVKEAIESYLATVFEVDVDYDLYDALARLLKDGIMTETADGKLHALSPQEGCLHVDKRWDAHLDTAAFYNAPKSAEFGAGA